MKIWVTCKNVWTNGPPPPPGKKLPVRLWRQELLSGVFDSPWAKCVKLNLKESVADYLHGLRTQCTGLNLPGSSQIDVEVETESNKRIPSVSDAICFYYHSSQYFQNYIWSAIETQV